MPSVDLEVSPPLTLPGLIMTGATSGAIMWSIFPIGPKWAVATVALWWVLNAVITSLGRRVIILLRNHPWVDLSPKEDRG